MSQEQAGQVETVIAGLACCVLGDRVLSLGEGLPGLHCRDEGGAHRTGRADRLAKQRKNPDSTAGVFVSGCI
jgi:hypothetical protein